MSITLAPGETKQINIVLTMTEFIEEQPLARAWSV